MIAIIGTSDQPCWLAEACKIFLLLLLQTTMIDNKSDGDERNHIRAARRKQGQHVPDSQQQQHFEKRARKTVAAVGSSCFNATPYCLLAS